MANQPKSTPSIQLKASCHCGAITVTVPSLPDEILECQCTICRRYGAAWGYWKVNEAKFGIQDDTKVSQYVWGDKEKSFNFCTTCGCMCYWWPFEEKDPDGSAATFGLNTRNMDPTELVYVDRKIENSWIFSPIGNGAAAHRDDKAKY